MKTGSFSVQNQIYVTEWKMVQMPKCVVCDCYFQGYGIRELTSKVLQIQAKKFFLDVKENRRGRFVKISEVLVLVCCVW